MINNTPIKGVLKGSLAFMQHFKFVVLLFDDTERLIEYPIVFKSMNFLIRAMIIFIPSKE